MLLLAAKCNYKFTYLPLFTKTTSAAWAIDSLPDIAAAADWGFLLGSAGSDDSFSPHDFGHSQATDFGWGSEKCESMK